MDTRYITVRSADGYDVPVRIYKQRNAGKNLPMLAYYHGGGFFGGGPDIVEQMCKVLVRDLDCVGFSWTVLVAASRIIMGAHYLTDTIAGFAVGLMMLAGVNWYAKCCLVGRRIKPAR